MLDSMSLLSVNVGQSETITHKQKHFVTGICKYPASGPVMIAETGVAGDAILDTEHHGGLDQAIYAYSAEDYDWWSKTLGETIEPGRFGENLTIRGLPTDMNIGDRLLIGEVVLEATAPRIPCSTFAARMQDSGFGMAFRNVERPGVYFRVLNEGEVAAGDSVTLITNDSSDVSVIELFRSNYSLSRNVADLQRFLDVPIAERFRSKVESWLASATKP